jgi:hypothetical protein
MLAAQRCIVWLRLIEPTAQVSSVEPRALGRRKDTLALDSEREKLAPQNFK